MAMIAIYFLYNVYSLEHTFKMSEAWENMRDFAKSHIIEHWTNPASYECLLYMYDRHCRFWECDPARHVRAALNNYILNWAMGFVSILETFKKIGLYLGLPHMQKHTAGPYLNLALQR